MTSYDNDAELESEGIPPLEGAATEDEGLVPPRDRPQGARAWGVTPSEQARDEPVSHRADHERPDQPSPRHDVVGRVVGTGGVAHGATDEGPSGRETRDDAALSAEEAALHYTDNP